MAGVDARCTPREAVADVRADFPAVFLEAAVRPAGLGVLAVEVAVARFFVVDLPAGRLAVALLPAALLATPVPDRRAVDDARLAAVDFPAVFLVAVAVPLRAAEP